MHIPECLSGSSLRHRETSGDLLPFLVPEDSKDLESSHVYQDILYPDENTDLQHVLKDLHHTCLKDMSAVTTSLNQPRWCEDTQFRQERIHLLTRPGETASTP